MAKREIIYKTAEEIELQRQSNLLVCRTHELVAGMLRPGVTGAEIDAAAETFLRDHGAHPSFKGFNGFPASLCVSVNEQVVHGIPDDKQVFQDGDVVSVDCGAYLNGFHGDSAYTYLIGEVDPEVVELCYHTNRSLYLGIEQARIGNRIGDIGFAIQWYTERECGYSVVRELVGHGVGQELHQAPEVPNYGRRGKGPRIQEGLVIAIEPMINLGHKSVRTKRDGWTVFTKDRKPSAHYEHSVAVRADGPDILSDHSMIEAAIAQNANLTALPEMEAVTA